MNFIESKLIKKDGKFFVEFGSEDTKTTRGKKYQIPLPENKNVKGVLEEYVDKELIMGIRPEDVHDEPRLLEEFSDCKVQAEVEVTELMGRRDLPVRERGRPQLHRPRRAYHHSPSWRYH